MLRIQHGGDRFQLRRGSFFGVTLGILGLLLGLGLLTIAFGRALGGDRFGIFLPAAIGLLMCFAGIRAMFGGELLLDAHAGGTRIAALSRNLDLGELRSIEVRWRVDPHSRKEVEVVLLLRNSTAGLTMGWISHHDPGGLAKALAAALGVPAETKAG
jgi:hypothetical protein